MICIYNEDLLLDKAFRVQLIESINSQTNVKRKIEAKKRHEIYRDMTAKYVLLGLQKEGLKSSTIQIMENRCANISIFRRVIKKLARAYDGTVERKAEKDTTTEQIKTMADLLDFDQKMMKTDRFVSAFKNALNVILPEKVVTIEDKELFKLKKVTMAPWQYDAVPDARDKEQALAIVFSEFEEDMVNAIPTGGPQTTNVQARQGAILPENVVARSPGTSKAFRSIRPDRYIVWSNKYHFTFDAKGDIISKVSPEDLKNPIQVLPGVTYAEGQDGEYWAMGGADLVDGSILVNTLLTDMFSIAYIQGFGQVVVTGKGVADKLVWGPHTALVLDYDIGKGEAKPTVEVVNANPPIADWMNCIEQYVALLLSTNELSPANIAVRLDPGAFPSGIAMLIERSQATNDVKQRRKAFRIGEMKEWEITKRWQNLYYKAQQLIPDFNEVGPIEESAIIKANFTDSDQVVTEQEKLANIKTRKEIGLNPLHELIMMDNPNLTIEEAKKKAKEILEEKLKSAIKDANDFLDNAEEQETEEGEETNGN